MLFHQKGNYLYIVKRQWDAHLCYKQTSSPGIWQSGKVALLILFRKEMLLARWQKADQTQMCFCCHILLFSCISLQFIYNTIHSNSYCFLVLFFFDCFILSIHAFILSFFLFSRVSLIITSDTNQVNEKNDSLKKQLLCVQYPEMSVMKVQRISFKG